MNKFVFGVVAGFGLLGLQAVAVTTNTWTGAVNDWNWNEGGNYSLGLPTADDVVEIPDNITVRLLATDTESFDVVNALDRIRPLGTGSKLIVVTDVAHDATLNCKFASGLDDKNYRWGELVKRGEGTLSLGEGKFTTSYYSSLTVEQGALRLPYAEKVAYPYDYSRLSVSNGATLFTVSNRGYTYVQELLGTGLVTNDWTQGCYLQINGGTKENPTKVEAQVGGMVRFYTGGFVDILSTANTVSEQTTVRRVNANAGSVLGLMTIGDEGKVSSAGTYQFLRYGEYGGTFRYLGVGEQVRKGLDLCAQRPYMGACEFDGGPYGGLNFCFTQMRATYDPCHLVLCGTNASVCVIGCPLTLSTYKGTNNFVTVTKRGSGTWQFAHNASRAGIANLTVEEGTLQYGSLYEKGEMCALGAGVTNLPSGHMGMLDPGKFVPYSIVLGDPIGATVPTFEYAGQGNGAWNTTRTIALCGDAILSNASADPDGKPLPLRLGNFSNIVDRTATLILSGEASEAENQIANVRDGANGKTAVVKVGTGTWTLTGTNNAFTGGLTVSNGLVRVLAPDSKYTWYRWLMKETGGMKSECKIFAFGLFGADYNRVHGSLSYVKDYARIRSGEVAFQHRFASETRPHYGALANPPRDIDKMFDPAVTAGTCFDFMEYGANGSARGEIRRDDASSWIWCLMRLDPDCEEPTSYDVATTYAGDQAPAVWSLEGSVNGVDWDLLHEVADFKFTDSSQWAFGRKIKASVTITAHTNGQAIVGHGLTTAHVIPAGCPVSVAPGATLEAVGTVEVDTMRLDPSGNGTFKGLSYANEGTIVMDAETRGVVSFPCTLINADGTAAAPHLSQWTFESGGRIRNGSLKATADGIEFNPSGLMILVR